MDTELIKTAKDLIEFVKDITPEVWEMIVWQQYVVAYISTGIFTLFTICLGFSLYKWKDDENWSIFAVIFGILTAFSFLPFAIEALPRLLNPVYYALMALKP